MRTAGAFPAPALPWCLSVCALPACCGCLLELVLEVRAHASITLYNGQHVQTTDALVAGFEKATGINVIVRSDDEDTLADQIVTEGSRSLADVIYTENTPAVEYLADKGLLSKVDPSTLANTPEQVQLGPGGLGGGVGPGERAHLQPEPDRARAELPTSVLQLADPRYQGEAGHRRRARPTSSPSSPRSTAPTARRQRSTGSKGIKANAGGHIYPDNETIADEVNRGAVAFGVVNQYYWYRMRAEIGASNIHSQIAYFAPHDPGYVLDISPAAVLKSSTHQADAQKFLAYLTSKPGQEIIAHSISFEYPIASGVTTVQPETPFDQLQPNSITVAELGDGSTAIALMKQAGLL